MDDENWHKEYHRERRKKEKTEDWLRAADAKKRRMAENCYYRDGMYCRAANSPCKQQCGDRTVVVNHGTGRLTRLD